MKNILESFSKSGFISGFCPKISNQIGEHALYLSLELGPAFGPEMWTVKIELRRPIILIMTSELDERLFPIKPTPISNTMLQYIHFSKTTLENCNSQRTLKTSKMDVFNVIMFFVKPKNGKTHCFLSKTL